MHSTNIHEAKTHLSKWVDLAALGEEVVICKNGRPVARLVGYKEDRQARTPGLLKGQIIIKDDFDELPDEFMEHFE